MSERWQTAAGYAVALLMIVTKEFEPGFGPQLSKTQMKLMLTATLEKFRAMWPILEAVCAQRLNVGLAANTNEFTPERLIGLYEQYKDSIEPDARQWLHKIAYSGNVEGRQAFCNMVTLLYIITFNRCE